MPIHVYTPGDRVMLSNFGINKYHNESDNPHNTLGTYQGHDGDAEGDSPHEVDWDNGGENNYNAVDLAPAISE